MYGINIRKIINHITAFFCYVISSEKVCSAPIFVKIDISPLCNLKCKACVHADPESCDDEKTKDLLKRQVFNPKMKMSYSDYCTLIDKIKKYVSAVSLYWMGEPLMHGDLVKMIQYAAKNNLGVHINTNFSFNLTDEYIENLVNSGLTHLTIAMDGMSQETYSKTRINGRLNLVKSNTERVMHLIKQNKLKYPIVELQYLLFDHNKNEYNDFLLWAKKMELSMYAHIEEWIKRIMLGLIMIVRIGGLLPGRRRGGCLIVIGHIFLWL